MTKEELNEIDCILEIIRELDTDSAEKRLMALKFKLLEEAEKQEPVTCSGKYGCKCDKHYTHPAPAWQGLSDDENVSIKRQINDAFNEGFEKGKAMSLVASIPPNFIKLEGMEKKNTAWQSLSDDEITEIYENTCAGDLISMQNFARAVEQALKEKNHE